jgi:ferredoxin
MTSIDFTQVPPWCILGGMADRTDKHSLNVPGAFYNDGSCIDCDLCREIAPAIFRRDDDSGGSYVWHQPANEAEFALALEALASCPTETIGSDG